MTKYSSFILKALLVSLLFHYLFITYFPIEWLDRLPMFKNELGGQYNVKQQRIDITLINESESTEPAEQSEFQTEGDQNSESQGEALEGVDQEKWEDLINRLEENTGFKEGFVETFEDLTPNNKVSSRYIHRDRKHEDIVIKEVFPTIYTIDQPFEDILKVAEEELKEFEDRNEVIEQFRSKDANDKTQLSVEIQAKKSTGNLGPLNFPPTERQQFFDKTLTIDKSKQLSDFIEKYFQYDPNEGDLPIATRELYSQNLERLIYTFSSDTTYIYLDFYLENLNKEEFLQHALYQAAKLQGSKTSTELLFAIEAIYEIQQRAWRIYFDFEAIYQALPAEKRDRLRIETLRRVNERYKAVLQEKGLKDLNDVDRKYRERRLDIIDNLIKNTPNGYRVQDAQFERGVILWEMGLQNDNEKLTQQAIDQWQSLINQTLISQNSQNNFSETIDKDFKNSPHLKLLDALLKAYQAEPEAGRAIRENQITNLLKVQRNAERLMLKRVREERILWFEDEK